jgi:hypothetical protein
VGAIGAPTIPEIMMRYLTKNEQQILDKALRRSTTLIHEGELVDENTNFFQRIYKKYKSKLRAFKTQKVMEKLS